MHRAALLQLLDQYRRSPFFTSDEYSTLQELIAFVKSERDCFERTLLRGHVTGSAFVLNHERDACLFMHHKKLGRWFQPGGHADGDSDILRVAAREALEETGIEGLSLLTPGIFDIDIHPLPARAHEPAHLHYDVRFAFFAPQDATYVVGEESLDLRWVKWDELHSMDLGLSIMRMANKVSHL